MDFGSTFLRYDIDDNVSSTSHGVAFANCIDGMIWGTATTPAGKTDQERELFGTWWSMPWNDNPIMMNLGHDKGFGDTVWENKADVAFDAFGSKIVAGLVRYAAVQQLMEQVGVFTLVRPDNWRGVVRNNVDALIHRLAGTGTEADAAHLRGLLEERYRDRITTRQLTQIEAYQRIEQASGARGLTAEGSIAQRGGNTLVVLEWERLTPLTRYANPFLQVFEGGVAAGVSVLSIWNLLKAKEDFSWEDWASGSNLAAAFLSIGSAINGALITTRLLIPKIYERVSFAGRALRWMVGASAVRWFGYGGALFDAVTNWFKAWGQYRIGNTKAATCYALAGIGMGLGGAALSTAGAGAINTGLGLAGVTAGVPVWGWGVAGVILLGLGLWWLFNAEDARYTELEFWLNDGTFGNRALLGRTAITTYFSLAEENWAFVQINYTPRKTDSEWKVVGFETSNVPYGTDVVATYSPRLVVEVEYPADGVIQFPKVSSVKNSSGASAKNNTVPGINIIEIGKDGLPAGGTRRTYSITGLNGKAGFDIMLMVEYLPKILRKSLHAQFNFTSEDVPWYY